LGPAPVIAAPGWPAGAGAVRHGPLHANHEVHHSPTPLPSIQPRLLFSPSVDLRGSGRFAVFQPWTLIRRPVRFSAACCLLSLLTPTLDSCLVTCCDCRGLRRLTGLFHRKHRGIAWIRESWRRQTACKHAHTLTTCRRTPGRFPPGPLARCMPASCFSKGWAIGRAVVDGVWFHLLHDLPERSLKLRLILPSLLALQLSFWRRPPSRSCSTLEVEVGARGIDVRPHRSHHLEWCGRLHLRAHVSHPLVDTTREQPLPCCLPGCFFRGRNPPSWRPHCATQPGPWIRTPTPACSRYNTTPTQH